MKKTLIIQFIEGVPYLKKKNMLGITKLAFFFYMQVKMANKMANSQILYNF